MSLYYDDDNEGTKYFESHEFYFALIMYNNIYNI